MELKFDKAASRKECQILAQHSMLIRAFGAVRIIQTLLPPALVI
jgi:hypothetical protein